MPTFSNKFSTKVFDFANKALTNMDETLKGTMKDAAQYIIDTSPVDTGMYVNSWEIGTDPNGVFRPGYQKRRSITSNLGFGDDTRRRGASTSIIARLLKQAASVQVGGVVYITNASPNARYVEYGNDKTAGKYILRGLATALPGLVRVNATQARSGPRGTQ